MATFSPAFMSAIRQIEDIPDDTENIGAARDRMYASLQARFPDEYSRMFGGHSDFTQNALPDDAAGWNSSQRDANTTYSGFGGSNWVRVADAKLNPNDPRLAPFIGQMKQDSNGDWYAPQQILKDIGKATYTGTPDGKFVGQFGMGLAALMGGGALLGGAGLAAGGEAALGSAFPAGSVAYGGAAGAGGAGAAIPALGDAAWGVTSNLQSLGLDPLTLGEVPGYGGGVMGDAVPTLGSNLTPAQTEYLQEHGQLFQPSEGANMPTNLNQPPAPVSDLTVRPGFTVPNTPPNPKTFTDKLQDKATDAAISTGTGLAAKALLGTNDGLELPPPETFDVEGVKRKVNDVFAGLKPQFDQEESDISNANTDYYSSDLKRKEDEARRQLKFGAARSGNINSPIYATQAARLEEERALGGQRIGDASQRAVNELRSSRENSRQDAVKLALAGTGDEAVNALTAGTQNALNSARSASKDNLFFDLFNDLSLSSQGANQSKYMDNMAAYANAARARQGLTPFRASRREETGVLLPKT